MNENNVKPVLPLRVGLFGGTFNPIHRGHLQAADEVLARYDLHRIYFIPSAQPPHKNSETLAKAHERQKMVQLALKHHPRMKACDIEIRRSGPSYTVDTLHYFRSKQDPKGQLFFIVGIDAFFEIDSWRSFRRLFDLAAMIVIPRPPTAPFDTGIRHQIAAYVQQRIDAGYQLEPDGTQLNHSRKFPIHLAEIRPMDIASSQIREMLRKGQSVDQWMTPEVSGYILEKGLYR